MDYNCKVLEDAAECESDLLLVALVRLQTITETFHKNVLNKIPGSADPKTPAWIYTRAMRTELHNLWMSFSPDLRQNRQYSLSIQYSGRSPTDLFTSIPHYDLS